MPVYSGSCHCGAIRFEIDTDIDDVYTCDCSLCSRKNALMTTAHESQFKLLAGEAQLSLYQWNARIARHYFCSVCGIYPFHRKRSAPDHYGINVRCLENFDVAAMPARTASGRDMNVVDENPQPTWTGPRA